MKRQKFEVAGAGDLEISALGHSTGHSYGFSIGASWGRFGYTGGVLDYREARRMAEYLLSECDKITPEKADEIEREFAERDQRLKDAGFL